MVVPNGVPATVALLLYDVLVLEPELVHVLPAVYPCPLLLFLLLPDRLLVVLRELLLNRLSAQRPFLALSL